MWSEKENFLLRDKYILLIYIFLMAIGLFLSEYVKNKLFAVTSNRLFYKTVFLCKNYDVPLFPLKRKPLCH